MHSILARTVDPARPMLGRRGSRSILLASLAALLLFAPQSALAQSARVDPDAPCYRWPAVDVDDDGVFDRVDHCTGTTKGCKVDRYGCETDGDGDGVCDGLDRCPDTPAGTKVNKSGCPGRATAAATQAAPPATPPPAAPPRKVSKTERDLVEKGRIRLENLYFESGSSKLLPESEAALRELGEALERYPQLEVEIQGHTDTRGSAHYNQQLSQTRAESVRTYLLEHHRLRSENLTARGYGESEPETRERNEEEMFRNRRVEIKVLNPEALPRSVEVEEKR